MSALPASSTSFASSAIPVPSDPAEPCGTAAAAALPRVVVAEDHPVSLLVLEDQLAGIGGLQVEACRNGAEAWAAVWRAPTALLLTDLGLPDIDGAGLARRIRAAEARRGAARLPIVAITATAGPEARLACMQAGIDTVLTKPVSFETLRTVVRRYL